MVEDRPNEIERELLNVYSAISKLTLESMRIVGIGDMNVLDIQVLLRLHRKKSKKRLVDLCFVFHIEDQHAVKYALKKLKDRGLVQVEKNGKTAVFSATLKGNEVCDKYREIHDLCLESCYGKTEVTSDSISVLQNFLRNLGELYDRASRSAIDLW